VKRPASAFAALLLLVMGAPLAADAAARTAPCRTRRGTFRVVREIPRAYSSYTQGLEFSADGGVLWESGGGYGESQVLRVDPSRGEVLTRYAVDPAWFSEGLSVLAGQLFVLTWREGKVLVLDPVKLDRKELRELPGEAWGLTHDADQLVMSDGSAALRFLDPRTLRATRRLEVRDAKGPVRQLNELEWREGSVYANVYTTSRIVRIDARSGCVTRDWDVGIPLPEEERARLREGEVLNGIAWNPATGKFWITGKRWRRFLEVELL
jgi:glutaminyl-peptide cyclotransferase